MTNPCVIEINDVAVTLADARGILKSASCALLHGKELLVGDEARARSRLNPRLTYDRFWTQLDQQPLRRPAGDAKSHADLAWFHLKHLWDRAGEPEDEIIFAVPPDWEKSQLALLLGIAQACGIPSVGLIAAPIAAASNLATETDLLYLDAQWQRVRATRLKRDTELALGHSWEASKRGISAFYEQWANLVAQQFLHELRFDPMHHGNSEQLLYNQLPHWLQSLHDRPSALLELEVDSRLYRIEMPRQALIRAMADDYQSIIDNARLDNPGQVVLSYRLAELPGLSETFEREGLTIAVCPEEAVAKGVLNHFESIRSDPEAPAFVTRLVGLQPGRASAPPASGTLKKAPLPPPPTHLLDGWHALALADDQTLSQAGFTAAGVSLTLDQDGPLLTLPAKLSAQVNGTAVSGDYRPAPGDRLRLEPSGQDWVFIVVDPHHGQK